MIFDKLIEQHKKRAEEILDSFSRKIDDLLEKSKECHNEILEMKGEVVKLEKALQK